MGADRLAALIEAQRPHLALWIPVLYGLGIALYFARARRAAGLDAGGARRRALVGLGTLVRAGPVARVLLLLALLPAVGFGGGGAAQRGSSRRRCCPTR